MNMHLNAFRWTSMSIIVAMVVGGLPAPGHTYRIKVTSKLVVDGVGGASDYIYGHASSVGRWARIDILAVDPAPASVTLNQYLLVSDSGVVVTVDPDSSTYSNGSKLPTLARFVSATTSAPTAPAARLKPGAVASTASQVASSGANTTPDVRGLPVRDVRVVVERAGKDTTIEGQTTKHYRVTADYSVRLGTQDVPLRVTTEAWTIPTESGVINPFEQFGTSAYDRFGSSVELDAKLRIARSQIDGVPIRSVSTLTLPDSVYQKGGVEIHRRIVQTTEITNIAGGDVDVSNLHIPIGYKSANRE